MRNRECVARHPLPSEVFELSTCDEHAEPFSMFRVLCVLEEHVGYKRYGKGRFWLHKKAWEEMVMAANFFKMVRPGDADCPF